MASSAGIYKRILSVLEKCPVDINKAGGRDISDHLKQYINTSYKENKFESNHSYWDKQYLAIQRLVNNIHKNKYKRTLSSSATGLTAEQCNVALSNDYLNEINQKEKSFRHFSTLPEVNTNDFQNIPHIPVMAEEVLKYLKPASKNVVMDMTFGSGGHSRRILESMPTIKLIALDRDPLSTQYTEKLVEEFPHQVIPLLGRFSEIPTLLHSKGISQNSIDCILFDFGCSSMQFDDGRRGFALSKNGPLDMRMDGNRFPDSITAADVLAKATEEDLYKIIKTYGEEKQARKIARAIVESRYMFKSLTTTQELSDLVKSVCLDDFRLDKLQRESHVATKTFQALRIFVNNELNEMNYGLILAHRYLKLGGRIATITFHSLEDTIVKRHLTGNMLGHTVNPLPLRFSNHSVAVSEDLVKTVMEPQWKMLHQHVITPRFEEVENNPRSRSAKLRAAVKIR